MSATAAINKANAQHSTGPRTVEGKATVSQNANKHNLTGRLQIREDERAAFEEFESQHRYEIEPTGPLEDTVFEQLIRAGWNLRRIEAMEAEHFPNIADEATAKTLDRLARYRGQHERTFYRALRELKSLQTGREILDRIAEPSKTTYAPLADFVHLRKVGFVLSNRSQQLCNALESYLFAPPPGQQHTPEAEAA